LKTLAYQMKFLEMFLSLALVMKLNLLEENMPTGLTWVLTVITDNCVAEPSTEQQYRPTSAVTEQECKVL